MFWNVVGYLVKFVALMVGVQVMFGMAIPDSKDSYFALDDTGGTLRNLSTYVDEVDGLPGDRNLNDLTALGDSGRAHGPGLEDGQFTIRGHWDNTASSGPDAVLGAVRTHSAAVDFEYGPEGSSTATSDIKYSGTCWVESYRITTRIASQVRFEASFRVEGTVTKGTF